MTREFAGTYVTWDEMENFFSKTALIEGQCGAMRSPPGRLPAANLTTGRGAPRNPSTTERRVRKWH